MDKFYFFNSNNLRLVGDYHPGIKDSGIIMCHGFTGDRHESGKLDMIANAFIKYGYKVLNFDFSGSGESDDDSLTVPKEVDDLSCAIKQIKSQGANRIGIFGYSLGGLIALKHNNPEVKTMVLVSPITNRYDNYAIKRFSKQQLEELESTGKITITKSNKYFRKKIYVDRNIIVERENLNQEELLSKVKCPVLIIHGDEDKVVPLADSKSALKYLNKLSRLEVLINEGHDFIKSIDNVSSLTINWFETYL